MDSTKLLAAFVAALAINELIHLVFEIWGLRQKIAWLTARMDKKPHGTWPININSFTKTILLHLMLFTFFVGVSFVIFAVTGLSAAALLMLSVAVLIICYIYTVLNLDKLHCEIGKLLKRYKQL